ncbi:MAG: DUF4388 domain-containing protein [Deltaproteobacteria bacterium]|nr:DUF4388 domain-containing protein [Deltaproteobacteria bacterium]
MSFTGDLEHLPIVDVIQLLHSTRKTGTLCLKSGKGESQLVFNDGYFVSANHLNNSVRIGQVLEEMNAVAHEEIERALLEQKKAGPGRKPLIATLIEQGMITRDAAYKGLEALIEMTIVEVLTWTSGTFSLDVTRVEVSDEYRYFPETLKQEIYMNAQSILMDALRIYDEKMRDGTLADLFFTAGEEAAEEILSGGSGNSAITADILGLEALDTLEKKIPEVFAGIRDHDPAEEHRRVIDEELPDIPRVEQDTLCAFLTSVSGEATAGKGGAATEGPALAVIVFSRDRFLTHAVTTACRHEERFVFSTDEAVNLDPIIEQSLSRDLLPVLVVDAPDRADDVSDAERIADLQQKRERYPQIVILQLVSPRDYEFSLHTLHAGVRAVFPRPDREDRKATFPGDTITFLTAFRSYLRISFLGTEQHVTNQFRERMRELDTLDEAPELVFVLLRFASLLFERSITFVVGKTELIAEKGIGVKADKSAGPSPPLMFRIPLGQPSVFRDVIANGSLYHGRANDEIVQKHLFAEIGAPFSSTMYLVPIKSLGRVIALIYGDFGSKAGSAVQIELLDILARHANLLLDNAFYRKGFEK